MTHPHDDGYPLVDADLSRALERTEGSASAAFVDARARLQPARGAAWTEVAGAYAMFDGAGSPLTQTFGLGMFGAVGPAEMDALEAFYAARGADVFHEVSPLADPALLGLLTGRGYVPVEMTTVLYRPIAADAIDAGETPVRVRRVAPGEAEAWSAVAAEGWAGEPPEIMDFIREMGAVAAAAEGVRAFLGEVDGRPVAAGQLFLGDGVALLSGASTVPAARRQGAQRALLAARLRHAVEHGCTLAMMGALPGSASQRNAQRQGFRIAYTRTKWHLRHRA